MGGEKSSVEIHLEYIKDGVDGINARLDALNGRTRKIESTSAVHSWALSLGGAACLALFAWLLSKL